MDGNSSNPVHARGVFGAACVLPDFGRTSVLTSLMLVVIFTASIVGAQEIVAPSANGDGITLQGLHLLAPPLQSDNRVAASLAATPSIIAPDASLDPQQVMPEAASERMLQFIAGIVRDNIPNQHVNEKDWNKTKEVYAGIKFRREGLKLETERRWKTVNHGLWRRYQVDLVNPDQTLQVKISDVYWMPDNRLHFHLQVLSTVRVHARQARWNLDVKLYSAHVEAKATVLLDIDAHVGFQVDPTFLPPALVLDPIVANASLQMASFEVDKIGHLGGDLAEELGDATEGIIRRELIEPQSDKLTDKLNRQIDKRRESLKVAIGDWLTQWLSPDS